MVQLIIKGAGRVSSNLGKIKEQSLENASRILWQAGLRMEAYAKGFAPVDTGRLRNSIHAEKISDNEVIVSDNVEYGVFVEFGTSKMPPQPFLTPAMDLVRIEFPSIIAQGVLPKRI